MIYVHSRRYGNHSSRLPRTRVSSALAFGATPLCYRPGGGNLRSAQKIRGHPDRGGGQRGHGLGAFKPAYGGHSLQRGKGRRPVRRGNGPYHAHKRRHVLRGVSR